MNGHFSFWCAAATAAAAVTATPGPAAGQIPGREMAYICRVSVVTTDSKGKVTSQPTVVARTVVRGDTARADVVEGVDGFKPRTFFLTYDGGHTLYRDPTSGNILWCRSIRWATRLPER
jgi:hypothetical protein